MKENRVISRLQNKLGSVLSGRKSAISFAKKYDLIYFASVDPDNTSVPVILGTTASPDQTDTNFCIGTHAGYDMAIVERVSSVVYKGYKKSVHRWYLIQIDLKSAKNLPFIFIGTRQQPKTFYARMLATRRQLSYLALDTAANRNAVFHSHFAVLGSPADVPMVYRLLTDDMIDVIAAHKYPFAVEIEHDSLIVFTEAQKPNQQLLDKLLHYGVWLAKEIDQRMD